MNIHIKLITCSIFVLISGMSPAADEESLSIVVESVKWPEIKVKMVNTGKLTINIWSSAMSWGYYGRSFVIHSSSDEGIIACIITPKEKTFTMNFPVVHNIQPKEVFIETINLFDGYWIFTFKPNDLEGSKFSIKAILEVKKTSNTIEHGVVTGKWTSPPKKISPEGN